MRRILLCATSAVSWLAVSHALAQQAITTPILTTDPNFRDLAGIAAIYGGTGFADVVAHNGVMRTGVFYRSEALYGLNGGDFDTLSSLHITQDIDLRTPGEIDPPPPQPPAEDHVPTGASYVNVNIYGSYSPPPPVGPTSPYPAPTTANQVAIDFAAQYRWFVSNPTEASALGVALLDLAHASGSVLYHCSGGKDRTGWTSYLLQSIAGVDPQTRMTDYLATVKYTAAQIAAETPAAGIMAPLLGVQPSFLLAAIDQISLSYPAATFDQSMYAYLTQGLGLTQADIYVLRAKMVDYLTLPGQGGFVGNAAAGAALLNALQNSPLSGAYTTFNYYLQSAIDAGTLGGVEAQVGGQVRADADAYLLRQPSRLDAALAPYVDGRDLAPGQARAWMGGLAGDFATAAHDGAASSSEHSAGMLGGLTYRIDAQASAFFALGYDWGSVSGAGGAATVGSAIGVVGGRYGFASLDAGPFVAVRASLSGVDYQGARSLGGGLGKANGGAPGMAISGQVMFGDVMRWAGVSVTPQAGLRVVHVDLGGFQENGSELALSVDRLNATTASLVSGVEFGFNPWQVSGWTITPTVPLAAEWTLGAPTVSTSGGLYGFSVSQSAAYDSRYLVQGGLTVAARRGAFEIKAQFNATHAADSNGVNGQVSVALSF
jgi:hypothetical protein